MKYRKPRVHKVSVQEVNMGSSLIFEVAEKLIGERAKRMNNKGPGYNLATQDPHKRMQNKSQLTQSKRLPFYTGIAKRNLPQKKYITRFENNHMNRPRINKSGGINLAFKKRKKTTNLKNKLKKIITGDLTTRRMVGYPKLWSNSLKRQRTFQQSDGVATTEKRQMSNDSHSKSMNSSNKKASKIHLFKGSRKKYRKLADWSQNHARSPKEWIDFYVYLSVVPSEIDEIVQPFRSCNKLHRKLKVIKNFVRRLDRQLKKRQANVNKNSSCSKTGNHVSDGLKIQSDFNENEENQSGGTEPCSANMEEPSSKNKIRRWFRDHMNIKKQKKVPHNAELVSIDKEISIGRNNNSHLPYSKSEDTVYKEIIPIRKNDISRIKFWQSVLQECNDSRLDHMLDDLHSVTDRRIFAIERNTSCRIKLDETTIYTVRGQPCMELRIIASTVINLQRALKELEFRFPRFYAQLIFSERFVSSKSAGTSSAFPTTDNFLVNQIVNRYKIPSVSVIRRTVLPIEEAMRKHNLEATFKRRLSIMQLSESKGINAKRIYDQLLR